jgi:nitrogen regulatory protein P-II 1
MKKIEAVIRPEKLEEVKNALGAIGVNGLTVTKLVGCGKQKGRKEVYRGTEYNINLIPKIKLEIAADDQAVDNILQTIITTARTGNIGDGKIFVSQLEEVVRIRTGETGNNALF